MSFLEEIEPLKQAAIAELNAAADLASLEQARVHHLGANGRFTALLKQLGSLAKEQKPAAGKAVNAAKSEIESALAKRKADLELQASLPKAKSNSTNCIRNIRPNYISTPIMKAVRLIWL